MNLGPRQKSGARLRSMVGHARDLIEAFIDSRLDEIDADTKRVTYRGESYKPENGISARGLVERHRTGDEFARMMQPGVI